MPMRHMPARYTPVRCMPVRYTRTRCILMKHTPVRCPPMRPAPCEMHAHEVHAHEMYESEIFDLSLSVRRAKEALARLSESATAFQTFNAHFHVLAQLLRSPQILGASERGTVVITLRKAQHAFNCPDRMTFPSGMVLA